MDKIDQIFSLLAKNNPDPQTELIYKNNYTLLVAIVLSAQATDISVNKATKSLFEQIDTAAKMLKLGEEKLKNYIKSIGLFNSKAKNIINLSKILEEEYNGEVPVDFASLNNLPGVGRKTANVFLNCAHGHPVIAVDTHVFRVSNRLGIIKCKTVEAAEAQLNKIVPDQWKKNAHHWLILHGRYVCKARKPDCPNCVLNKLCEYNLKNLQHERTKSHIGS